MCQCYCFGLPSKMPRERESLRLKTGFEIKREMNSKCLIPIVQNWSYVQNRELHDQISLLQPTWVDWSVSADYLFQAKPSDKLYEQPGGLMELEWLCVAVQPSVALDCVWYQNKKVYLLFL